MDFTRRYFDQGAVWRKDLSSYQNKVLEAEWPFLVNGADCMLEIGPGAGALGRYVKNAGHIRSYIATDLSETPLRHVEGPVVQADLSGLPFADSTFDVVVANDVIEHIPDAKYDSALDEIFRVAKRVILIAVPLAENMPYAMTQCENCGEVFHMHHHQRQHFPQSLSRMERGAWRLRFMIYSGQKRQIRNLHQIFLSRMMGRYVSAPNAVCPVCGGSGTSNESVQSVKSKSAGEWRNRTLHEGCGVLNSEIIGVFQLEGDDVLKLGGEALDSDAFFERAHVFSKAEISFKYEDIFCLESVPPHRAIPYYVRPRKKHVFTDDGLVLYAQDEMAPVIFCFPQSVGIRSILAHRVRLDIEALDGSEATVRILRFEADGRFHVISNHEIDSKQRLEVSALIRSVNHGGFKLRLDVLSGTVLVRSASIGTVHPGTFTAANLENSLFVDIGRIGGSSVLLQNPTESEWLIFPECLRKNPLGCWRGQNSRRRERLIRLVARARRFVTQLLCPR